MKEGRERDGERERRKENSRRRIQFAFMTNRHSIEFRNEIIGREENKIEKKER